MQNDTILIRIEEIINKGNTGAIILPVNPSTDAVAAATTLYLGLSKLGKNVTLVCSTPIQDKIISTDKIKSTLATAGDNLVISFPYTDGSIDKVDYNIQGNFFNLIIIPRPGYPKLNPNQVQYSYTGGVIDFIITIDSPNLNSLGQIYIDNQSQFQGKDIINIDRHITNSFFGTVNFVNKTSSSTCELVFKILKVLNCEIDKDMATNLYAGISTVTNNFTSYSVTAETFETVANLLKLGALKKTIQKSSPVFQPRRQPLHSSSTAQPQQNNFEKQATKPIETVEKESQNKEGTTPQDWLKPKIFRGGGLI